jgi:lipopolysaccharide/colanic/teichoic acid biosynthesis glycosyltransferase
LPQLFNVLSGQMSLVGPQPLPLQMWKNSPNGIISVIKFYPELRDYGRFLVRWDIDDFNDAARLDLYYIDNWSLNLDLDILSGNPANCSFWQRCLLINKIIRW